jgi:hypothetical protein
MNTLIWASIVAVFGAIIWWAGRTNGSVGAYNNIIEDEDICS